MAVYTQIKREMQLFGHTSCIFSRQHRHATFPTWQKVPADHSGPESSRCVCLQFPSHKKGLLLGRFQGAGERRGSTRENVPTPHLKTPCARGGRGSSTWQGGILVCPRTNRREPVSAEGMPGCEIPSWSAASAARRASKKQRKVGAGAAERRASPRASPPGPGDAAEGCPAEGQWGWRKAWGSEDHQPRSDV